MRPVPAHPASTGTSGHNPVAALRPAAAPLVTDLSLDDLERDARHAIGEMAYAYYAGGADDERLLGGNVGGLGPLAAPPAGAGRDRRGRRPPPRCSGRRSARRSPIAPTAIQGLAHPEGEVATARGAAAAGALMILSSLATCPLEDVAAAAPGAPRWMQVYILRERARTAELVGRAAAHGYGALVLTVDAPVSGLRLREWRMGVHLPDDLALPNLAGDSTESAREGGFMAVVTHEFEPALTPDDIGWLAGLSALPVVAKGVQRADDAVRCVDAGAAAVVVSNHGARQLADAPATADILAEIVDAVAGRAEVYVDGGIRRVARRGQGAGARGAGRAGRAPVAVGAGHRRRRRRGGAAALVRVGAAADHGAVRRGDGRRARPQPGAPGTGLGDRGGDVVTTVAAMLAARAEDDRTGVHGRRRAAGPGARRWPRGRHGGRWPARCCGDGHAPHRRAPPQRARVPVLAQRRRTGRRGDRRHEPDPAGRGPGGRHPGHRLRPDRHRRRGRRACSTVCPSAIDEDHVLVAGTRALRVPCWRSSPATDDGAARWSSGPDDDRRGRRCSC